MSFTESHFFYFSKYKNVFPLNMHNKKSSHPINMTHGKLNLNTVPILQSKLLVEQ